MTRSKFTSLRIRVLERKIEQQELQIKTLKTKVSNLTKLEDSELTFPSTASSSLFIYMLSFYLLFIFVVVLICVSILLVYGESLDTLWR